MAGGEETFVLRMSRVRLALVGSGLAVCAILFYLAAAVALMAAVAVVIDVGNLWARFALGLAALGLAALATYYLLLLRTTIIRIEVGPERLKLRMPAVRGPLPLLRTIRAEIPYGDIASVETREEVYSSFGLVTVQCAFSVLTREGARLPLGVMAENWGAQMRFDEAAARIAARARLAVVDRGAVRVGGVIRAMIRDVPPWSAESMTLPERTSWRRRGLATVQIILVLVSATAILRSCVHS